MTSQLTPSRAVLTHFRDLVTSWKHEYTETSKETVQTIAWVVTLATGLLSLAALNEKLLSSLGGSAVKAEIILLLATAFFGVIQRILQHLFDQLLKNHWTGFQGYLLGRSLETASPPTAEGLADVQSVIAALRDYFDLDYSFLVTYKVTVEKSREIYKSQYDLWESEEQTVTRDAVERLAAYAGKPKSWVDDVLAGKEQDIGDIRRISRRLRGLGWAAFGAYALTALSFVGALLVLGIGLIGRHSIGTLG